MFKLSKASNEARFHFPNRVPDGELLFVKCEELLLNRIMKMRQIFARDRLPDGHEYVRPGFHKDAFIDSQVDCPFLFRFVGQDSRLDCSRAIETIFQKSVRSVSGFGHNPDNVGPIREDFVRKKHSKMH
jgi:hypothetical protein